MTKLSSFLLIAIAAIQSNGQSDVVDGGGDVLDVVDATNSAADDAVDAIDYNTAVAEDIATTTNSEPLELNIEEALNVAEEATSATNIISVSIDPAVALTFSCHLEDDYSARVPCETPNDAELQLIATAAEEFIRENRMVESALQSEDAEMPYNREGIVYEGTYLAASLHDFGRRRLDADEHNMRNDVKNHLRGIRRHRELVDSDDNPILLTGTVNFRAPTNIYASDPSIPSKSYLSEILLAIFVTETGPFLDKLEDVVDESSNAGEWLSRVVGYEALFENDLEIASSAVIEEPSESSLEEQVKSENETESDTEDSSDNANIDANGEDEESDSTIPAAIVSAANNSVQDDSSKSGSNNILLIVGAAGAGASLLLLVAGLCYAKRSYKPESSVSSNNAKKNQQQKDDQKPEDVIFQPGKNNPRSASAVSAKKSSSSIFKKGLSNSGRERNSVGAIGYSDPLPPPVPIGGGIPTQSADDEDDESQADFLLARAALNNSADAKDCEDDGGSQANNTFGDDMSYAFTVEGESLAPLGNNNGNTMNNIDAGDGIEDEAIGLGGMASFANDKGVFRWNEEGTKMVYTPNVIEKTDSNEQNGFVYDEGKRKWVVKDQVIGEKNVSFKPATQVDAANNEGGNALMRTRSIDSTGTGFTGMSEFTYDDIALDFAKRTRSEGTVSMMDMSSATNNIPPSPSTPGTPKNARPLPRGIPGTPGTPSEQGVEVTADGNMDEFVSNTNVEKFMMGGDDSTAFSGFTDFTNNNSFFGNIGGGGYGGAPPPPPPPLPRAVTPERISSSISDEATMATFDTGNPGRIVPKAAVTRQNKMKISEDAPFDEEDIPFDERVRTRSGRRSKSAKAGPASSGASVSGASVISNSTGLVIPNMLDDMEDDQSDSEASVGSANSEQVLKDLDTLSRFMMDRKQTSKKSSGSISSSRRSRASGGSGGINNSRRIGGRKSSFGNKGRSNRY